MTKFTITAQESNASEPLPDGDVPEDGSGLDGVWTRTIEARKLDRDWRVAVNSEIDRELEASDFPSEGFSTAACRNQSDFVSL